MTAIRFARNRVAADFAGDRMLAMSLERAVEIIGEAAGKISAEFRNGHQEIPWGDMIGMRNRMAHAYFDIDPAVLWSTVSQDIPDLIVKLESVLKDELSETTE